MVHDMLSNSTQEKMTQGRRKKSRVKVQQLKGNLFHLCFIIVLLNVQMFKVISHYNERSILEVIIILKQQKALQ